jgi:hypothetical protein
MTGITANQPLRSPSAFIGAENHAGGLIDKARGIVDERLANGGDQRFVSEDGADFVLGDVHEQHNGKLPASC